jgi:cobalamin biosynthesis protein CbiD
LSPSTSQSEATVTIEYRDQRTAEAILRAIEPDNLQVPDGIEIEAEAVDGVLNVRVNCGLGIGSLVATLDDLLSCVQAAERAIEELG